MQIDIFWILTIWEQGHVHGVDRKELLVCKIHMFSFSVTEGKDYLANKQSHILLQIYPIPEIR